MYSDTPEFSFQPSRFWKKHDAAVGKPGIVSVPCLGLTHNFINSHHSNLRK